MKPPRISRSDRLALFLQENSDRAALIEQFKPRDQLIIQLAVEGKSVKEIAAILKVTRTRIDQITWQILRQLIRNEVRRPDWTQRGCDPDYISIREAKHILGLSAGTIYKMAARGELEHKYGGPGTRWWFRRDSIENGAHKYIKKIILY